MVYWFSIAKFLLQNKLPQSRHLKATQLYYLIASGDQEDN